MLRNAALKASVKHIRQQRLLQKFGGGRAGAG